MERFDVELKEITMKRRFLRKRSNAKGMTLIELMIACFVLAVGMLGSLSMIFLAIATNSRNKFDTTGTMIAQLVIEQINTLPTNATKDGAFVTDITLSDCEVRDDKDNLTHAATPHVISIKAGDVGAPQGAALVPNNDTDLSRKPGDIDFTEANPPAGYSMKWHTCGDIEYDVRWNIIQISDRSKLVTVAARQVVFSRNNVKMYAPPVTLRSISGP
jgi:prepilin-type N-terminal cleavage/methylation domain-containing protein